MSIRENIANFVTLLNLVCGFLSILFILQGRIEIACYLVLLGGFFDFIDGLTARALNISSELGKQLDSLSDLVTFGVVPGLVAYHLLTLTSHLNQYWPFIAVLIPMFSAYRLGKFNIDERQTKNFLGMPTPANGIFWISLYIIYTGSFESFLTQSFSSWMAPLIAKSGFLVTTVIVSSFLLVVPLPLFGFKFDSFSFKGNEIRFLFVILALLLLITLAFTAIPIIIILYILFSMIHNFLTYKNEVQS